MSPIYVPGKVVLAKSYTAGDRYFNETSLLLHGNGTNGSTTVTDNSTFGHAVTAVGNAQISTAQSKFGSGSLAFDGNGDYFTVTHATAFNFGTAPFTIEAWVYPLTAMPSGANIWSQRDYGGISLRIINGKLGVLTSDISLNQSAATTLTLNQWSHAALTREGNVFKVWLNGALDLTTSSYILPQGGTSAAIGQWPASAIECMNGYIDDFRVTKGVARYTANFTPPTAPFADGYY